jgi:hypothetical protein
MRVVLLPRHIVAVARMYGKYTISEERVVAYVDR